MKKMNISLWVFLARQYKKYLKKTFIVSNSALIMTLKIKIHQTIKSPISQTIKQNYGQCLKIYHLW